MNDERAVELGGLVFDSCEEMRIYPNMEGSITIQQYNHEHGDQLIMVVPAIYVERVVNALRKAKRDLKDV